MDLLLSQKTDLKSSQVFLDFKGHLEHSEQIKNCQKLRAEQVIPREELNCEQVVLFLNDEGVQP
jgi:hypothetical protein